MGAPCTETPTGYGYRRCTTPNCERCHPPLSPHQRATADLAKFHSWISRAPNMGEASRRATVGRAPDSWNPSKAAADPEYDGDTDQTLPTLDTVRDEERPTPALAEPPPFTLTATIGRSTAVQGSLL